jgi:hypothetical protein
MRVTLECINFYAKVLETEEKIAGGHFWRLWKLYCPDFGTCVVPSLITDTNLISHVVYKTC